MTRMFAKKLILAALVGAIGLAFDTTSAHAFWRWHHGSSGGCWGSSGGSSGGCSGGCWGSSGGSSGGCWGWGGHRHRYHGSSGGCWGSSGGCSGGSSGGCWGSSGGSSGGCSGGCWGSSGGSSGGFGSSGGCSGGSYGGTVVTEGQSYEVQSQPAVPPPAPVEGTTVPMPEGTEPAATEPAADASTRIGRDAVMLSVWVPTDAKIYVNGNTTSSTGSARSYVSRGLQPGASYSYEVRAELVRDGRTLTETKQVTLVAGQKANVEFGFEDDGVDNVASEPARTTLTLNVPSDAKVYLSGKETKSTGSVREFSTTRLQNGGKWNDYAIRVEIERNGEKLTKEQTVSLASGETRNVSFDFDAPQVASNAKTR